MKETDVRHVLIDNLKQFGHIEAIENGAGVGNPDVNYCFEGLEGWIEVKYRESFPKRESTPAIGKCLKPSQPIWFMKRLRAGSGRVFFFLRIGKSFFLVPGYYYKEIETMTESELRIASAWIGETHSCNWLLLYSVLMITFKPEDE